MRQSSHDAARFGQSLLHELRLFFIALQFFTRIPIPRRIGFCEDWLHGAVRYFPMVGIVVGAATGASYALFSLVWNPPLAALLSTALGLYLTGALHEDGFADTCDGFGGGYSRERILEIMRDSRIGAYGAIGIGMLLAIKCVCLASLSGVSVAAAAAALLCAHPLSRLAAASLVWRMEYVKAEGKAKPLARPMSNAGFSFAAVTALVPVAIAGSMGYLSWHALVLGMAALLAAAGWLTFLFKRRIGGYTGDCLGAVQQLGEATFYLAALAVAHS